MLPDIIRMKRKEISPKVSGARRMAEQAGLSLFSPYNFIPKSILLGILEKHVITSKFESDNLNISNVSLFTSSNFGLF